MLQEYFSVIYNKINSHFNSVFEEKDLIKPINNYELPESKDDLKNKILMNLVSIKLENKDINSRYYESYGDGYVSKIKPLLFNIYIYFHSTFYGDRVNDGLLYLSEIISYFHTFSVFNTTNTCEMTEKNLSEFNANIINDDLRLFESLKISYCPSILIKFGLIPIYSISISNNKVVPGISSF